MSSTFNGLPEGQVICIAREVVAASGAGNPMHKRLHKDVQEAFWLACHSAEFRAVVRSIVEPDHGTRREWEKPSGDPHGNGFVIDDKVTESNAPVSSVTSPVDDERPYPPIPPEDRVPGCWVHDETTKGCELCASTQYREGPAGVLYYRADLLDYLRTDPALGMSMRNELARTASAIRFAAHEVPGEANR